MAYYSNPDYDYYSGAPAGATQFTHGQSQSRPLPGKGLPRPPLPTDFHWSNEEKLEEFRRTEDAARGPHGYWHDMNMSADVVKNWTVAQGQDEFVQNFQDQCHVVSSMLNSGPYEVGVVPVGEGTDGGARTLIIAAGSYSGGTGGMMKRFSPMFKLGILNFQPNLGGVPGTGTLTLVNYNSVLSPRNLTAGWSGDEKKSQSRNIIGQFGDGLKSAISVFNRIAVRERVSYAHAEPLQVWSVGYKYRFAMEYKANCRRVQSLHYTTTSRGDLGPPTSALFDIKRDCDTVVQMRNVKFDVQRYLFLQESYTKLRPALVDVSHYHPGSGGKALVTKKGKGGINHFEYYGWEGK